MKRLAAVILTASMGLALAGCSGNPSKEGVSQLESKEYKQAEASFKEAVKQDKNTADAYRGIGIACWEQKEYKAALKAFKNAVKAGTIENATLYNLMGGCALKLNDGKSALSYYEKGLAASGSSDELKKEMEYNVIVSYEKMQNWEKAKSKLNEYLEKYPDDETQLFAKRIIALPGETIEVKNGIVYITDKNGNKSTARTDFITNCIPTGNFGPYTVPLGSYFVMGDNRNDSWDSRYWDNKTVKKGKIIGKVKFRYFPNPGKIE